MATNADHDVPMTNEQTTIDSTVVQSRILQSESLLKSTQDDEMDSNTEDVIDQPTFTKLSALADRGGKVEYRRVRCPPHRYTPLREDWEQILMPLVQFLKLQASFLKYRVKNPSLNELSD